MNRLAHLQQTLPQNLRDNPATKAVEIEFVVLNYGDTGGLHEWMTSDPFMTAAIGNGRIVYARTQEPETFHMSHAKNMAHRLATGDIVCNLDADNFTGPRFGEALAAFFKKYPASIISPSHVVSRAFPPEERGFFGRMALPRRYFENLGGYDENYVGWGSEDTDLARRARMIGLKYFRFEDLQFLRIIAHGNDERTKNMFSNEEDRQRELARITHQMHQGIVEKYYRAGLDRLNMLLVKPVIANSGTHFGLGNVTTGLEELPEKIAPLRGTKARIFNEVVRSRGYYELVKARISPRIANLGAMLDKQDGPS